MNRLLLTFLAITAITHAQEFAPTGEKAPPLPREFRAAWIASAYNIDWPSKPGLSAAQQQAEMRRILDTCVALHLNAVVFQVRPMGDALYASSIEPWSHVLTGTMGRSPGYDPLAYCLEQAHARGLEVHAWFNPFRALCNNDQAAARNHITRTRPDIVKRYGTQTWCDPGNPASREHALRVILDVVRRYDIDGVHLDDYFYPYPKKGLHFPDGKNASQRRACIDGFVHSLYTSVKDVKPWVRVGISPFGIWRPGVPAGIEAGLDSCEDICGDSRKWLKNAWVDYLAPQLYWRIEPPKQSFPKLLEWWREQGQRPVWPGIATERILGPEDGRPASEIRRQIDLTRRIGRNWHGHIHWNVGALVKDKGGIRSQLARTYTQPALVPPLSWQRQPELPAPAASANHDGNATQIRWTTARAANRVVIQARIGGQWRVIGIRPASANGITIPRADAVAVTAIDRFGHASVPRLLANR